MKSTLPLTFSVAVLATMIVASLMTWFSVAPGLQLAIHFGIDGTPNGYASAPYALSVIPAAATVSTALFALSPRFRRRGDISPAIYAALWIFVVSALAAGHFMIVSHALSAR